MADKERETKQTKKKRSPSQTGKSGGKKTAKGGASVKTAANARPAQLVVMPIVLSVLAVLLLIFFFPKGENGSVGGWIAVFFRYLFGGGRFLLPFFLLYAGIFWRKNWREERLLRVSLLQCAVFLLADSLFCYFPYLFTQKTPRVTWELAAQPDAGGIGGGILGNFLAGGLVQLIGFAAAGVLLVLLLLLFGCYFFGTSPFNLLGRALGGYRRKRALRREVRQELREEERQKASDEALREKERERVIAERKRKAEQKALREERRAARRAVHPTDEREKQKFNPDVALGEETDADSAFFPEDSDFDTPFPSPSPLAGEDGGGRKDTLFEEPAGGSAAGAGAEDAGDGGAGEAPLPEKLPADELEQLLFAEDFDKILSEGDAAADAIPIDRSPLAEGSGAGEAGAGEEQEAPLPSPPPYRFPPITLLKEDKSKKNSDSTVAILENARKLEETLRSFRVNTKVENYSKGPTVTRYELMPEKGVRVRSIANLVDDIALNLAAEGVRIEAPIPGKAAVGVEVPNKHRETVYLRTLFDDPRFKKSEAALAAALGVNVGGEPVFMDLAKMPHLLIAGTTGSGKSVCMNCLILSLLFKYSPEDVKMIMIDPKKVEFKIYNGLPHLITPVVSEAKKAAGSLAWAVTEMERRYEIIESVGVRDIKSYNNYTKNDPEKEHMPYLVLFIDELADLMFVASNEVEESICRIAQKGRAAGLHLVIGTQRPSVDVITGLIKANVPSRIAFSLPSQTDSRTVIDVGGAEKLIGMGDMLVAPVGLSKPVRLQGPFVSDEEVEAVTTFIKDNAPDVSYDSEVIEKIEQEAELCGSKGKKGGGASIEDEGSEELDPMLEAAIELAVESGKISTSLIQRRLSLGYGRAAKLIDRMEKMGIVSPPDGQKPRTVLLTASQWAEQKMSGE